MAEEKLGTLQYDMLVDQKKLEQQLEEITKKLQEKDKQWKEILSGQGNVVSPKINVADLNNLNKSNLDVAKSAGEAARSIGEQAETYKTTTTATRALMREERLKIAVDEQAIGSVSRLRAENQLYVHQISKLNPFVREQRDEIIRLNQAINANKSQIQSLSPALNFWGKLTAAVRTYATAYLSVQAVLGFGRAVYGQTKELDSLNFSMKTVIKSSTELAQTQKFLSDVAVNYGGDLLTLSERYIKFRAAAVQSNMSAGETQKIFESVSKAAGTLGLKTDELSGVYLALEQMISKGKVTTEELRRQLGERLPGAFGIMANALGVTIPELDKLLKKGEILSTVALPKFAAALEKAYGIESLTKIDTLAAAQGRLSTEFTGLIKSLEASGTFKNTINALAGLIGFIKDNIGVIGVFTKALVLTGTIMQAYKLRVYAIAAAQFVATAAIGVTRIGTDAMSASMLRTAMSINTATRSWTAFGAALKANAVGLILAALSIGIALFSSFNSKTKETADAMGELNKEFRALETRVKFFSNSFANATKGSEQQKNAIQELNTVAIKYNASLLTENSTLDENNKKRTELIRLITEEKIAKRSAIESEAAQTKLASILDPIQEQFFEMFKGVEGGAAMASDAYAKFIDRAKEYAEGNFANSGYEANKQFGNLANSLYLAKAALEQYNKETERLNKMYQAPTKGTSFEIADIEKAKKEFEEYEKLKKQGAEKLLDTTYVSEQSRTFREWVENQIYLFKKIGDMSAVKELTLALADLDKAEEKSIDKSDRLLEKRNEAIKKLNDKYLVDQEDFANYEMGIQSTRIANMEDGLDKEKKLNDLAYERRIAAIEKEKIATLKLLNEAAGIRVGSKEEIKTLDATGYSKEVQDQVAKARESDLTKRKNAENDLRESNLKSEKDYQIKINEIRRDANDQFLSGIQKEKAAINEKYDEWARKAASNKKLVDEIEGSRRIAISEVDRQNAIDRLDFEREIEYKKNEIRFNSNKQVEKLDAANFEVYYKTELKRGKLLLQSANLDKQQEGRDVLNKLIQDTILQGLSKQEKSRARILSIAKEMSGVIAGILNLTNEESSALNGMVDISSKLIEKGLFSKEGLKFDTGEALTTGISGATQILSIILNQSKANKKAQDDWNNSIEEAAKQYALLNIEAAAYRQQNIFGIENPYSKAIAGAKQYGLAMGELQKAAAKLEAGQIQIGTKKVASGTNIAGAAVAGAAIGTVIPGIGNAIGAGVGAIVGGLIGLFAAKKTVGVFDSLKQHYNEIYNKDTFELNPQILADYAKLDESTRKLVDNWKDIKAAAIQAQDEMRANFSELAGTLGTDFSDALIDAFRNNDLYSAIDAFHSKVGDVIASIIQQMLFAQYMQPFFDKAQEGFNNSFGLMTDATTGKLRAMTDEELARIDANSKRIADFDITDDLDVLTTDVVKGMDGLSNAMSEADRLLKEKGYAAGLGGSSAAASTGISKGIQALTEDTGRRLEGLINSIRESGVINIGNTKQLVESSQMIQGYAAQSLSELRMVNTNLSTQIGIFNDWTTTTNGTGGKGIKVYVQ